MVHKIEVDIVNHCLLLAHMTRARSLDRSESASSDLVVHRASIHSSVLDGGHLLLPHSLLLARCQLLVDFFVITAPAIAVHVIIGDCVPGMLTHLIWFPVVLENVLLFVRAISCGREEGARSTCLAHTLVLRAVESRIVFRVLGSSGASSYTRHVRCICSVAVFTLDGLDG